MADFSPEKQINEIALRYACLLKEHIGLHSLYVYGSYASGKFTADSTYLTSFSSASKYSLDQSLVDIIKNQPIRKRHLKREIKNYNVPAR